LNKPDINNSELIGVSIPIVELKQIIRQVAPTDVTVMVTGESGVGKEVVAKEIHKKSKRFDKPFITVNCGAIPEGIIESELFGHQKGSFTGAVESRKGYFEIADEGTIFLDEIGELPLSTQVKFLRVIEYGEFTKVGASKSQKVNVRIIAATNKDLQHEVDNKSFREDLFYRLRSINIHIPPLRDRKNDIELLFKYFTKSFCEKNSITFKGITEEALSFIINYNWPGNIRQLKNVTESLITLYSEKKIELYDVTKQLDLDVKRETLPAPLFSNKFQDERELLFRALFELKTDIMDIKKSLDKISNTSLSSGINEGLVISENDLNKFTFDEFEQELLTYFWHKYGGNINKIAQKLKISYRTLYRKYKLYGFKKFQAK
jgi:DNA-binding NtrC family response regulator